MTPPVGMTRKGYGSIKRGYQTDAFFITLDGPQAHDSSGEEHFRKVSGIADPLSREEAALYVVFGDF